MSRKIYYQEIDIYLGDNPPQNADGSDNPPDLTRLADQMAPFKLIRAAVEMEMGRILKRFCLVWRNRSR